MDIHILDSGLIDKIAAGEVVERPASIVKELTENSIDAGATSITVEIKDGGISYIKITDNGRGIPKDQTEIAFMRHATSKLYDIKDLEDIATLGFRGEALSSIASVAKVELITKTEDENEGTLIALEGGKVVKKQGIASVTGTSVTVKDIFYAVPARRKFLKKPSSESAYISETVNRLALGHPDISFRYINNGNVMLQTNGGGDLKKTALYIYGRETAEKMLPVEGSKEGYSIKGLVGKPELARGNRNYENFFINGRYIKSSIVSSAAEDAYKGRLMTGKFPAFIIDMKVPADTVDVNVHPTKLEVRFSKEDTVYDLIYESIKKVFEDKVLIPKAEWDSPSKKEKAELPIADTEKTPEQKVETVLAMPHIQQLKNATLNEFPTEPAERAEKKKVVEEPVIQKPEKSRDISVSKAENEIRPVIGAPILEHTKKEKNKNNFFSNYKLVGQLFSTYWIIEQENSFYIIDQHAAHERVLYEELTELVRKRKANSQLLLQPIVVNTGEREAAVIEENRELLENFGFVVEKLGISAYALKGVPYIFGTPESSVFFTDIIDKLDEKAIKNVYEAKLDTIATISCKAAVKGNDRLSFTEARGLIEKLLKLENPFNCPHGRPTIIEMTKYELEKKFKRIQD